MEPSSTPAGDSSSSNSSSKKILPVLKLKSKSSIKYKEINRADYNAPTSAKSNGNKYNTAAPITTSQISIADSVKLSMISRGYISISKVAKEDGRMLSSALPKTPVTKDMFLQLCEDRRKYPILYEVEFQIASSKNDTFSCTHATQAANKKKNQSQKSIPYDYNRVVLDPPPSNEMSTGDYINASFVDSLSKPNAYLVSQGPREKTIGDFWRMVWQTNVNVIIMLTKTSELIRVMCHQYWPTEVRVPQNIHGFSVTIEHEERLANYYIRTMTVKMEDEEGRRKSRSILQFHYTEWPGYTCPFPPSLLDFRRRVRQTLDQSPEYSKGQMLVHCSDGGGRTGVYCQIDAQLELLERDGVFDIFGYLKKLKSSRMGLIENVDQLKFVYDTLEEFVICGKTCFPVSELSNVLKHKSIVDPQLKINEYEKEFLLICKQMPRLSTGDCAGGFRSDNRAMNRDIIVMPPDKFRPYLTSFQGITFTDYINAVFVDAYRSPREYMVTEWPQAHTISYLWSLVYDFDASAVVVLANPERDPLFPAFWPSGKESAKYGVFTIDPISNAKFHNIKSWIFRINKKIISMTEIMAGMRADPKICQLFQLTCWPMEQNLPMSTHSLVDLMNMVERWRKRQGIGPVVVVSPDGYSRTGVYCAANACIEQVLTYGEMDIFTAVKVAKRHRPQMIETMTEYKFCYEVVLHYIMHYLNDEIKEDALPPLINKISGVQVTSSDEST